MKKLLLNDSVSFLFTRKETVWIQVNKVECQLAGNSIIDILRYSFLEFLNIVAPHRISTKKEHSSKEEFMTWFPHLVGENCCEHHEVR